MNSPPQVALIGHGVWGRQHARVLRKLEALRWVYDNRAEQLEKVTNAVDSLPFIWEDEKVEGVVIATPPDTHYRIAAAALQAGKHVLVEKPMTTKVGDAQLLKEAADKAGLTLMVGHIMRYHTGFQKFHLRMAILKEQVKYLYSIRQQPGRGREPNNVLWSLAPHDVSMLIALAGMPKAVRCIGKSVNDDKVEDVVLTLYESPNGVRGHVFVSWLHPKKIREVSVVHRGGTEVFHDEPQEAEPLEVELTHFLRCIEGKTKPLTDAEEGLNVVRVLAACQRSLEHNGKWEEI